jgi:hypothetical protein
MSAPVPVITAIGRRLRPVDGVHQVIRGPKLAATIKKP